MKLVTNRKEHVLLLFIFVSVCTFLFCFTIHDFVEASRSVERDWHDSGFGAPTIVRNLVATGGNHSVALDWQAPENGGGVSIDYYKIYRGNTSGGESLVITLGVVLNWTDTGLINGQKYYYKVSAVNAVQNEGPQSNEANAKPETVPDSPQNLLATPSNALVSLAWAPPSTNGGSAITGYKIYRGTSPGGEIFTITIGNITTWNDSNRTNGQIYYYKISAVNGVGEGATSNEVDATPAPPIPGYSAEFVLAAIAIASIVVGVVNRKKWI